tara:strand:- start:257 stop:1843 length:1587 start_codon:yes stop_codon:yes gene_type:complete
MKKILLFLICIPLFAQSQNNIKKPKLIIGIVVDQMRFDYIQRFWNNFSEEGFKKLINQGHFFRNTRFGYVPTYTGPGHASIFTGTTPSMHGIIANNWYDKNTEELIYCAGDGNTHTICNCEKNINDVLSEDGKMSPKHMLTSTIGDEIKLFNSNSKVIGISLKDRGAILSAGHSANAAYWMDKHGEWITSSYYMQNLPEWLVKYQSKKSVSQYLKGNWSYKNMFNHSLDSILINDGAGGIKVTPMGNTILKDLAIEIIKNEKLGKNEDIDMLTISFSSTDYIGHKYGPHADEIKDTYIKLDKDIAEILKYIDKDNSIVFLTADHGVVSEPHELIERKIPSGYFDKEKLIKSLNEYLNKKFVDQNMVTSKSWIKNFSNLQLFLDHDLITHSSFSLKDIQEACAAFILNFEGVKNTFTQYQMMNTSQYSSSTRTLIQRGFNPKRSGDVIIVLQTGWISNSWKNGGTTHGSSYSYDTHVPLIFWGAMIPKGHTDRLVNIRDIAPTISTILGISYPNGCTGNPLSEITQWRK